MRYVGVDLARFLAIVGMMAAHLVGFAVWDPAASQFALDAAEFTDTLTEGIAAPLFAVLGGLSSVFATRRLLREHRMGAAVAAVALRGALLVLIGLLLGMIENPVVVVLAYYGAAMMLVAPLIAARGWLIGAVATVLGIAGGTWNSAARAALDVDGFEGRSVTFETFGDDWVEAVRALLLTGVYPAITWSVYLLVGVLVGRLLVAGAQRVRLGRVSAVLAGGGALLAVVAQLVSNLVISEPASFGLTGGAAAADPELLVESASGAPLAPELWAQLLATPHSGSPVDLLRTLGIAFAVIGLLVLLCDSGGRAGTAVARRAPGRLLDAVRAAGAAPLTIYALHVIATGWLLGPVMEDPGLLLDGLPWWSSGLGAFLLQLAGVLGIGAILSATGRRGPLEAVLSGAVRVAVRA
ncbi:hypothetical protein H490_0105235 [Leucobacter sp. UCD-THU]|uniref:heparan-alpha-glucosaminide N-acetyltransferase domain-containing protein n=1 Tax=Leucobacter sp. UCD-THU TaxID=1292023 RepID=UPI000369422B|nr:heparan-alpha-glucosaminide N-acetyltransferase domain-containing protein [Leucobacter sp. UCD-THU]EYT56006.1 hypothetical protein H490_0105235 [Leucobacter sp. UCD-THU]